MGIFRKKEKATGRPTRLSIDNPESRTMFQKGFDDMLAISIGDKDRIQELNSERGNGFQIDTDVDIKDFLNVIRSEEQEQRRKKTIRYVLIAVLIITVLVVGFFVQKHYEKIDGKIRVNYSSSDFKGENYEDVVGRLESEGFTNVRVEPIEDLITGWITKDGEVEEVRIGGSTVFSSGSRFVPDTEIIVVYHTFSK